MLDVQCDQYKQTAQNAIRDPVLQDALADFQNLLGKGAAAAIRELPEGPRLRLQGRAIRAKAISHLDILLETLAANVRQQGGHVFFAADASAAVDYCIKTAKRRQVRSVVKGKSMVTEEIGLNHALAAVGIDVFETDLGEYIVQLANERPSHIIAPAVHKTKEQIGRLFAEKLNIPYTDDPTELTMAARKALRAKFLAADMGVSGCNLACAATGHITTVSNEGNIRMASTLPRISMAFMGMERVAATLQDHHTLLRLLTRAAAAQKMAGYISYVGGPATPEQADGPHEFHLVILDNGRSRILQDETFREILFCIRCAACLNVCPVYGKIGGHAYGSPYCGPIGAVATPLMAGINRAHDLCRGETLCGACRRACPVDINIPRMLLALRAKLAHGDPAWGVESDQPMTGLFFHLWSQIVKDRSRYDFFLGACRQIQRLFPQKKGVLHRLPPPLMAWTKERDIGRMPKTSFVRRWHQNSNNCKSKW